MDILSIVRARLRIGGTYWRWCRIGSWALPFLHTWWWRGLDLSFLVYNILHCLIMREYHPWYRSDHHNACFCIRFSCFILSFLWDAPEYDICSVKQVHRTYVQLNTVHRTSVCLPVSLHCNMSAGSLFLQVCHWWPSSWNIGHSCIFLFLLLPPLTTPLNLFFLLLAVNLSKGGCMETSLQMPDLLVPWQLLMVLKYHFLPSTIMHKSNLEATSNIVLQVLVNICM